MEERCQLSILFPNMTHTKRQMPSIRPTVKLAPASIFVAAMQVLRSDNDFQLQQMIDILNNKLVKRGIDIACLEIGEAELRGQRAKQSIILKEGIDQPTAKKIVKMVKDKKMKVQAAIQGEKVRITGKKRDDLQTVMAMLREEKLNVPLQFNNFRD